MIYALGINFMAFVLSVEVAAVAQVRVTQCRRITLSLHNIPLTRRHRLNGIQMYSDTREDSEMELRYQSTEQVR